MPPLSADDVLFIESVPIGTIWAFRNKVYSQWTIDNNPQLFTNHEWIDVPQLRFFLAESNEARPPVKTESDDLDLCSSEAPPLRIKSESDGVDLAVPHPGTSGSDIRIRTCIEDGHEVLELFSDDEEFAPAFTNTNATPNVKAEVNPGHGEVVWELSDTIWLDPGLTSEVCTSHRRFRITKELTVERLERLYAIPSVWPVPRVPTAFIVIYGDKYDNLDKSIGGVILDKDNDSYSSKPGTSSKDSKVMTTILPGEDPIECYRARHVCKGVWACRYVDQTLLAAQRNELDTSSRDAIVNAEQGSRQRDGSSPENRTSVFLNVILAQTCKAKDNEGQMCNGRPTVKHYTATDGSSEIVYFIGCTGYRGKFKTNDHRSSSIPPGINPVLLAKMLNSDSIDATDIKDTPACSKMNSPRVGSKQKYCPHSHIRNGVAQHSVPMVEHPCGLRRRIFIPTNTSIKMFLLAYPDKDAHHNHPVPVLSKITTELRQEYTACVEASGPRPTVRSVDKSLVTHAKLGGKTPVEYSPAFVNSRAKRQIVKGVKQKTHPNGLGILGVIAMYEDEKKKPVQERYIHRVVIGDETGGTIIFTCYAELLALIHDVTAFEGDTTYKRVSEENLKEWEMVIFYAALSKVVTIMRVYIDSETTDMYEAMFDGVRDLVFKLTGRHITFKKLQKGGNLICMNSDMCIAQVIGAGRSFLKVHKPEYSGITMKDPAVLVTYFVKLCRVHIKRGIHELQACLKEQPKDYEYIKNCLRHIKSWADVHAFEAWVRKLGNKQVLNWWNQKRAHDWILPCMIRELSRIENDDWDCTPDTTNAGEGQHAWTNGETGTKLHIVEAIERAQEADLQVLKIIRTSKTTGVQQNHNNELRDRLSRSIGRTNAVTAKKRAANSLRESIAEKKDELDKAQVRVKELKAEIKNSNSAPRTRGRKKTEMIVADCTSSGRPKGIVELSSIVDISSDSDSDYNDQPRPGSAELLSTEANQANVGVVGGQGSVPLSHAAIDTLHVTDPGWSNQLVPAPNLFAGDLSFLDGLGSVEYSGPEHGEESQSFSIGDLSLNFDWGFDIGGLGQSAPNHNLNDPIDPTLDFNMFEDSAGVLFPSTALRQSTPSSYGDHRDYRLPIPSPSPPPSSPFSTTDAALHEAPVANDKLGPSWTYELIPDREVGCSITEENILAPGTRRERRPSTRFVLDSEKPKSKGNPGSKPRSKVDKPRSRVAPSEDSPPPSKRMKNS
ncbi:hypothetical protein VNI00_015203 [Paramarasmius palmivorus]|uniref:Uncharacterized protein n=1 Tax=Paramarasmius palmivorus TaxID=297713 RepID=A0AAW0BPQ2_9AGAR